MIGACRTRRRCSTSGFSARFIRDKNEPLERLVVQNGSSLAKTHHAPFDAHLIGIDPDFKIHVSRHILGQKDGQRWKR